MEKTTTQIPSGTKIFTNVKKIDEKSYLILQPSEKVDLECGEKIKNERPTYVEPTSSNFTILIVLSFIVVIGALILFYSLYSLFKIFILT